MLKIPSHGNSTASVWFPVSLFSHMHWEERFPWGILGLVPLTLHLSISDRSLFPSPWLQSALHWWKAELGSSSRACSGGSCASVTAGAASTGGALLWALSSSLSIWAWLDFGSLAPGALQRSLMLLHWGCSFARADCAAVPCSG